MAIAAYVMRAYDNMEQIKQITKNTNAGTLLLHNTAQPATACSAIKASFLPLHFIVHVSLLQ